jgi:hypothetical protein
MCGQSQSQSQGQGQGQGQDHFATDGRSVSMSWCRAPSGAHDPIFLNCLTATVLSCSGALSDEMSGLFLVSHSLKCLSICTYIFFNILHVLHVLYIKYINKPLSVQARYSRLCPTGCG